MTSRRWRIGFDIGGTFTDFILYDGARESVRLHKRLTTPHDPSVAALAGLEELVETAGIDLAEVRDRARHDARDQCRDRAQGREARPADDARLPRHPRDGHGAAIRHLRSLPALSGTLRVPRSAARDPGAHRPRRPHRDSNRPGRDASLAAPHSRGGARRSRSASSTPIATRRTSGSSADRPRGPSPSVAVSRRRARSSPRSWEYQRCVTTSPTPMCSR